MVVVQGRGGVAAWLLRCGSASAWSGWGPVALSDVLRASSFLQAIPWNMGKSGCGTLSDVMRHAGFFLLFGLCNPWFEKSFGVSLGSGCSMGAVLRFLT